MEQAQIEPITVQITPTLELLKDIAITAAEGGIQYWAVTRKYQWRESVAQTVERLALPAGTTPQDDQREQLPFPVLRIEYENPDGNDPETLTWTISPACVRKGLQLAITPGVLSPESNTFKSTYTALTEDDACAIDADAADTIIQLGIFGKLVFC